MLDQRKLSILKTALAIVAIIFLLFLAYGVGSRQRTVQDKKETPKVVKEVATKRLTQEEVSDFLIAYYTKKEIEENRNRYKPFMTTGLYQAELDIEASSVNQAYKGYVVDFQFKDADIYIDEERLIVLVRARFTNTLLAEKGNYDKAQRDVLNEVSLKLTYVEQNGKYLVNQKAPLILTEPYANEVVYSDYGTMLPTLDGATSEEGKEAENGQETQAD